MIWFVVKETGLPALGFRRFKRHLLARLPGSFKTTSGFKTVKSSKLQVQSLLII